jgi:di/tricarboxylate transporter
LGWEGWFTLAVLAVAVTAMVREWTSPAMAALAAVIVLLGAGIVTPEQAFSGFSNSAPITVAALYVLAHAVDSTGALRPLLAAALDGARSRRSALARLLIPSGVASAFLNNTPIVAMLVPQVVSWSERRGEPPSRLLMPLAFGVTLGGIVTTIGTSTNLVVSGLLEKQTGTPFGLFEITYVGLPVAVAGLALLILFTPRLLPDRVSPARTLDHASKDFVLRMRVVPGGPLEGKTVEEASLRHLQGVFLAEIERQDEVVAPVAPTTPLQGGDLLVFVGRAELVVDLSSRPGLVSAESEHVGDLSPRSHFYEAVIGVGSPLIGRTPKQAGFRGYYQAAIVAIHRDGQPLGAKLGEVRLRMGDTLLLIADEDFHERWWGRPDFMLIAPAGQEARTPSRQARWVLAIGAGVVLIAGFSVLPILHTSLLAATLLVATRALSLPEARRAIDLEVFVLIAASFGLSAALQSSGLADLIAEQLVAPFGAFGWRWALFGVVIATVALTELLSNNTAAALMFPIAMSTAASLGAEPRTFAIAIALGASISFLTPIGYQTNMMVFGPGGYRFGDYVRVGWPLSLVCTVLIVWLA